MNTLSEVFYEAACWMSDHDSNFYGSCFAIEAASRFSGADWSPQVMKYQNLMGDETGFLSGPDIEMAAYDVHWEPRYFRTFMLLMASEAVK